MSENNNLVKAHAVKSFSGEEQDGYLIFQDKAKSEAFLSFVGEISKNIKHKQNNNRPYENHGEVLVPEYIAEKLKTRTHFFVRTVENI